MILLVGGRVTLIAGRPCASRGIYEMVGKVVEGC